MVIRSVRSIFAVWVCWSLSLTIASSQVQTAQEDITAATSRWLKSVSAGDRTALNAAMDAHFLATTPAGDVLTKDRLVPDDLERPVQRLPALTLDSPAVRLYGGTAVLMGRLKSADNSAADLNGTFVYTLQNGAWKLIALHLSPQK